MENIKDTFVGLKANRIAHECLLNYTLLKKRLVKSTDVAHRVLVEDMDATDLESMCNDIVYNIMLQDDPMHLTHH
eukprot:6214329-Pleurochrysis_carterae.AAC.1